MSAHEGEGDDRAPGSISHDAGGRILSWIKTAPGTDLRFADRADGGNSQAAIFLAPTGGLAYTRAVPGRPPQGGANVNRDA